MNNEKKVVAGLNHQSGDAQGTANTMTNTNENWEKEIDEKVLSFAYAVDRGTDIQVLAGKAVIKAFIRTLLAKRDEEIREMVEGLKQTQEEKYGEMKARQTGWNSALATILHRLPKEPQE